MQFEVETERAWAAGFFDGEGSVYLRKPGTNVALEVVQISRIPLDRFRAAVNAGVVGGPYGPYSGNRKAYYAWRTNNKKEFVTALCALDGYLSKPKVDQINRVLSEVRPHRKPGPKCK